MKWQRRPALIALSAVLLCTFHETSGSSRISASSTAPSEVGGRRNMLMPQIWPKQTNISLNYFSNETFGNHDNASRSVMTPKHQEESRRVNGFPFINTSRSNIPTVIPGRASRASWSMDDRGAPLCAYRVFEGGIGGQLCFRHTQFGFQCHRGDCRTVVARGTLVANILTNGSVLLQWTHKGPRENIQRKTKAIMSGHEAGAAPRAVGDIGTDLTGEKNWLFTPSPKSVFSKRRHSQDGFELSCWWNGSYTQFECAGVHLGSGCRDFLLTELHENVPYRICLRSLASPMAPDPQALSGPAQRADPGDCVEFTVSASGMQDIVIAMTTVGGAICVMLVIICLLVAYITENIMSPTTQHTYSYHTHSHH